MYDKIWFWKIFFHLDGGDFVIEISSWMDKFVKVFEERFGDRVWFVGLQGSYGRGEATETKPQISSLLGKVSNIAL